MYLKSRYTVFHICHIVILLIYLHIYLSIYLRISFPILGISQQII